MPSHDPPAEVPGCDVPRGPVRNTNEPPPAGPVGAHRHRKDGGGQPPILKTFPPHTGQVPWRAGLPFFIVIRCGLTTSTFFLSLTQYASAIWLLRPLERHGNVRPASALIA